MGVSKIKLSVDVNVEFEGFSIRVQSTHGREILYTVSEKTRSGWENLTYKASEYILKDFKKTTEHKEITEIISTATKKYGY